MQFRRINSKRSRHTKLETPNLPQKLITPPHELLRDAEGMPLYVPTKAGLINA